MGMTSPAADTWVPVQGGTSGINWRERLPGVDPYLVWADVSAYEGFGRIAHLPLMLDISAGVGTDASDTDQQRVADLPNQLKQIGASVQTTNGSLFGRTCRVDCPIKQLDALLTLGFPAVLCSVRTEAAPSNADIAAYAPQETQELSTKPALFGVIDDSASFAQRDILGRVNFVWQQGALQACAGWTQPMDMGYGLEPESGNLTLWAKQPTEAAAYALAGITDLEERRTHGAAIASLAVGQVNPLLKVKGQPGAPNSEAACAADVAFVQLSNAVLGDSSGGGLPAQVLDGIRYLLARGQKRQCRVYANVSLGTLAGPHSGNSVFDKALLDLLNTYRQLCVVMAAGNSRTWRCHAQWPPYEATDVEKLQKSVSLVVDQPFDDPSETYIELWFDGQCSKNTQISIKPPLGLPSCTLKLNEAHVMGDMQAFVSLVQGNPHEPSGVMLLLVIAPTKDRGRKRRRGASGEWEINVECGGEPINFHAWIERDAGFSGSFNAPQAQFSPRSGRAVNDRYTLTSHACAQHDRLIVVGATSLNEFGSMAPYSSIGPTRGQRKDPDCLAPGEVAPGIGLPFDGPAGTPQRRISGTSAAAPMVVRALLNRRGMLVNQLGKSKSGTASPRGINAPIPVITPVPSEKPLAPSGHV
jgi:Subtilase family